MPGESASSQVSAFRKGEPKTIRYPPLVGMVLVTTTLNPGAACHFRSRLTSALMFGRDLERSMKHFKKAIWISFAIALVAIVGRPVLSMLSWREDYGEAEPLVQTILPLAQSMKAYDVKFGRGPASLEDLLSFAPELDVSALKPYDVTLSPDGRQRLFVQVNRRFAFEIDDRYQPSWAEDTGQLQPPKADGAHEVDGKPPQATPPPR